jgi:hypothetical protein
MRITGPWTVATAAAFLRDAVIPLRLSALSRNGTPVIVSLWFLPEETTLWCATRRDSNLAGWLGADSRCGFEVARDAPPYRGVRGQAHAALDMSAGPALLDRLMERYGIASGSTLAAMLSRRRADEVAIRLTPDRLSCWDYSARMSDAFAD